MHHMHHILHIPTHTVVVVFHIEVICNKYFITPTTILYFSSKKKTFFPKLKKSLRSILSLIFKSLNTKLCIISDTTKPSFYPTHNRKKMKRETHPVVLFIQHKKEKYYSSATNIIPKKKKKLTIISLGICE